MYFRASDPSKEALVSPHHVAAPETQRVPHVLFAALHERSHRRVHGLFGRRCLFDQIVDALELVELLGLLGVPPRELRRASQHTHLYANHLSRQPRPGFFELTLVLGLVAQLSDDGGGGGGVVVGQSVCGRRTCVRGRPYVCTRT